MTGYYDYVLGLIPLSLAVITGAFLALGFQPTTAVPAGALVAVGLVGHAMFVNTPVSPTPRNADGHGPDSTDSGFNSAD